MISRSIIQFIISYIFFECHYFILNFNLILCHLSVTAYDDRINFLYDYVILGFRYYGINFFNDHIILEFKCYKSNSFKGFQ